MLQQKLEFDEILKKPQKSLQRNEKIKAVILEKLLKRCKYL
jgi:hypothetical protein